MYNIILFLERVHMGEYDTLFPTCMCKNAVNFKPSCLDRYLLAPSRYYYIILLMCFYLACMYKGCNLIGHVLLSSVTTKITWKTEKLPSCFFFQPEWQCELSVEFQWSCPLNYTESRFNTCSVNNGVSCSVVMSLDHWVRCCEEDALLGTALLNAQMIHSKEL